MQVVRTTLLNSLFSIVVASPLACIAQPLLRQTGGNSNSRKGHGGNIDERMNNKKSSSTRELNVLFGRGHDCVNHPEGWYDSGGPWFDCLWYRTNRCEGADDYERDSFTASQACCACGGGITVTPSPTASPTPKPKPPEEISSSCSNDPPDWHDSFGEWFNCDWYEEHGCDEAEKYENFGRTANEACCVCGGGKKLSSCSNPNYQYMPVAKTWEDHHRTAKRQRCDLASVHSRKELALIRSLAKYNDVWLGGKRIDGSAARCKDAACWEWSDGTAWDFHAWGARDPNNRLGSEDRVNMYGQTGKWNDYMSSGEAHAVYKCCNR